MSTSIRLFAASRRTPHECQGGVWRPAAWTIPAMCKRRMWLIVDKASILRYLGHLARRGRAAARRRAYCLGEIGTMSPALLGPKGGIIRAIVKEVKVNANFEPRIRNYQGIPVTQTWLDELQVAYRETVKLLDELDAMSYSYKQLAFVILEHRNCPIWCGICGGWGSVRMDPTKHEARSIAHEMGHGFHERWREDGTRKCNGEAMAEAIRYFVEERMGRTHWNPNNYKVLNACKSDFEEFKKELKGKIAQLG